MFQFNKENQSTAPSVATACRNTEFPSSIGITIKTTELVNVPESVNITREDAIQLERETVDQSMSPKWVEARAQRLTASNFSKVAKRKKAITDTFLKNLFNPTPFSTQATEHGLSKENIAKGVYTATRPHVHLHDCGLVVNPAFPFLGASPDGKVCDGGVTGILEVKCPYSARDSVLEDFAADNPTFCLKKNAGSTTLKLNCSHDYYYQVQGQLMVTGAPFCDFIVYTSKDIFVERVLPNKEFSQILFDKLFNFYKSHALKYLQ